MYVGSGGHLEVHSQCLRLDVVVKIKPVPEPQPLELTGVNIDYSTLMN